MVNEAKDIATFIVEPTGADIYNPDGFTSRRRFQDSETLTYYTSSQASNMFQNIFDEFGLGSTDTGCRIYLKNGLYEIDNVAANADALIEVGTQAEGDHVAFHMEGETRDGVILRNVNTTEEGTTMFLVRTNFYIRSLTFDGANLAVNDVRTNLVKAYGSTIPAPGITLDARDCHFMRNQGSCCSTDNNDGGGSAVQIVDHCLFDQPAIGDHGQVDVKVSNYAQITNNIFDKTNGEDPEGVGSLLTTAGLKNLMVRNNIFRRPSGTIFDGFGTSIESIYDNIQEAVISDNYYEHARVFIGHSGAFDDTTQNIWVTNNKFYHGGIYVDGNIGGAGSLKNVFIENNQLLDSWFSAIHVNNMNDFITIRNNSIKNSNKSLNTFNGQQGLIYLKSSTNVICENNTLYMGVVSPEDPDFSPQGIRYGDLVNPTIMNNRIINRTVANNSYQDNGGHTGLKRISKTL